LVRLRVKKSIEVFSRIFESILRKAEQEKGSAVHKSPFAEITEEDIEKLFG
jgi:hypothetical protein